jgi:coenzyme F420 hydrogenase subunit beta
MIVVTVQNVETVVANNLCISCGSCLLACKQNAIQFVFDKARGMIHPKVSEDLCISCKSCIDVCYGVGVDQNLYFELFGSSPKSIAGHCLSLLMGHSTNNVTRYSSSSGGIVTSLLRHALESKLIDGAIVAQMNLDESLLAKSIIVRSTHEIESASGSKYCPIPMSLSLASILEGEKYAFVGLPCHVYSVRKLAESDTRLKNSIRLYIGLLCGGMPNLLGTQFILEALDLDISKLEHLEFRGGGWPGRLLARGFHSGQIKEVSIPYPEYWLNSAQYFLPLRCTLCRDGFNEFSDISCGDAWFPNTVKNDGLSLIIVRTKAGGQIIDSAQRENAVYLEDVTNRALTESQHGLIEMKTKRLMGRVIISNIIRRFLPVFDLSRIQPTNAASNVWAMDLYFGRMLASRKSLWWLFRMYLSLKKYLMQLRQVLHIRR